MALPLWIREKLFQKDLLCKELRKKSGRITIGHATFCLRIHHQSHAASAFLSPFPRMPGAHDGWRRRMDHYLGGVEQRQRLGMLSEIRYPHSLGLLYSAFTYYTGFKVNSGEYKVMGLAPYGEPRYTQAIFDNLIDLKEDGSFRLNMEYFNYCTGLTMTNSKFDSLFGGPPRKPEELLTQHHMDLAASVQAALEEVILRMTRSLAAQTGSHKSMLGRAASL